jgi:arsenate reductase (thioredoxin)
MKYVLFVCTQNAGRSQMAQAFFERYAPADMRPESAGLEPAARIHPVVVEAMREVEIDISDRRPKKLTVEMQLYADLAITLACGGRCPYVPTLVEDWDVADPDGRPIEEMRAIRDDIAGRVDDLVLRRLEEIRADHTAHSMRLAKMPPALVAEFESRRTPEETRACTDAVLAYFDEVRIRSHILTLAERRTRKCLQADTCYELLVSR